VGSKLWGGANEGSLKKNKQGNWEGIIFIGRRHAIYKKAQWVEDQKRGRGKGGNAIQKWLAGIIDYPLLENQASRAAKTIGASGVE